MTINPELETFNDLTDDEAKELQDELECIIYRGEVNWDSRYLLAWEAAHVIRAYASDRLLIVSTVYVTRALYSLVLRGR